MKKYSNKNNTILFIIFTILIIILILVFVFFVKKAFDHDTKKYQIPANSFVYDNDNNYVNVYADSIMSQKFDKHYYLRTYTDSGKGVYDLGKDVVMYNKDNKDVSLYGSNYQVYINGDVKYNYKMIEFARNSETSFFKLDDRKYLIIAPKIKTLNNEIDTTEYLIINIDKSGNAILMNNEMNVKTLKTTVLTTNKFNFDVARERLIVGENKDDINDTNNYIIDLKKINGSTNTYKDIEPTNIEEMGSTKNLENNSNTEKSSKSVVNNTTNNNTSNTSTNTTNNNTSIQVSDKTSSSSKDVVENISKSINLVSLTPYTTYVDIRYQVSDPLNQYLSVFLKVKGDNGYENTINLSKNKTSYRVRDLKPNSQYSMSLCYTINSTTSNGVVLTEVANTLVTHTNRIPGTIVINRIKGSTVYFTVYYDKSFAFDSAEVVAYSDSMEKGKVKVVTTQASSSNGFSSSIDLDSLGSIIELKLEDCIYEGDKVDVNIGTKFVNE